MHESLLGPSTTNCHSGYLKIEEGKNNWVEYWVVIRDNQISLYSDECSEESGEEAMKTIELTSETRCELLQRRNYHFRFKLLLGSDSMRLKCSSAFHRQQWISQIMLASSKEKVVELNGSLNSERERAHRRTISAESQFSSDADSLYEFESGLESSGTLSGPESSGTQPNRGQSTTGLETSDLDSETTAKSSHEPRSSKGLLRRLSFKASNRLHRNSKSSPRDEFGAKSSPGKGPGLSDMGSSSPLSPPAHSSRDSPLDSSDSGSSSRRIIDVNKVFDNPAFVPSPTTSPASIRRTAELNNRVDLIDI